MQETVPTTMDTSETHTPPWGKIGLLVLVLVLLIFGGFAAYQAMKPQLKEPGSLSGEAITAAELQERHGLKIHLIGVTAGGGMIDFRLKITDHEKARRLLEELDHLPRLIVAENGYELLSPEGLDDDIEWEDGGILFNFYPNDQGFIRPGSLVLVKFGDEYIEMQAQ